MPNETAGWSDKSASWVTVTYDFYLFVILSSYRGRSHSNTWRLWRAIDSSRFAQKKSHRFRIKADSAVYYRHYTDQWRSDTFFSLIYFYIIYKIGTPTCGHIVQVSRHDKRPPLCLKIFIKHRPPTCTASRRRGKDMCCSAAYCIILLWYN